MLKNWAYWEELFDRPISAECKRRMEFVFSEIEDELDQIGGSNPSYKALVADLDQLRGILAEFEDLGAWAEAQKASGEDNQRLIDRIFETWRIVKIHTLEFWFLEPHLRACIYRVGLSVDPDGYMVGPRSYNVVLVSEIDRLLLNDGFECTPSPGFAVARLDKGEVFCNPRPIEQFIAYVVLGVADNSILRVEDVKWIRATLYRERTNRNKSIT